MSTSHYGYQTVGEFYYADNAKQVQFVYSGVNVEHGWEIPWVEYTVKEGWAGFGPGAVKFFGDEPHTQQYYFAEEKEFYDRWGRPVFPLTPVPEPATYAMLSLGLGVLGFRSLRRRLKPA